MKRFRTLGFAAGIILASRAGRADWPMYAGGPQHNATSAVAAQDLDMIRFQTPVDLAPPYSGGDLFIHYGSPLVTSLNTLLVPMKTNVDSGFQIQAFNAFNPTASATGTPLWTLSSDYILPPHAWTPSYSPALTGDNKLYYAGAGGVVNWVSNVDDAATPAVHQVTFYNHTAADNSSVFINTPLTAGPQGDIYFGVQVTQANPNVQSSLVRLGADGSVHTFHVSDVGYANVAQNCAPALSPDGSTLYVAVNNGGGGSFTVGGALVALDAATLQVKATVPLIDPKSGNSAYVPDLASSSPTVGPDGDVYFGVVENPFPENNDRGWLLHFSADLSVQKTSGAFGWDDTPSVVPASAVPSYTGSSNYLLMTKYNNYNIGAGDGQNKIAILDPNATQIDPVTGVVVMNEVLTQLGVNRNGEIAEWCINNAAVDPATKSVLANSEDGHLYRWDLTTNTLSQDIQLTAGLGEAYTPTVIGPDGTVYAINDAKLFAVGTHAISQIDLGTGTLLLHNESVAAVTTRLRDGYNKDGELWNGPGLVSSAARTTPGHALGAVSGNYHMLYPGALFDGQTVADTDVLLMYTLAGDASMDGQLTMDDYALLEASFLMHLPDPTWVNGDFNYDGVIDYQDYAILDENFLQMNSALADAMIAQHLGEFGSPYAMALEALGSSVVPEPATLALILPAGLLAIRRRRAA